MGVLEPAVEVVAEVELELSFDVEIVGDAAFGSELSSSRKKPVPWPPLLPAKRKRSQSVIGPDKEPSKICVS